MAFSFRVSTNWCHDFPKLARESGFHFNMHGSRVRVDWNRISAIDIDRVICERDFSIIDENINNVIDYCLESEYDVKILDSNFVKLFRLAQLSVEYLLYCKQYLDHSVIILKDELRLKIEQNVGMKKEIITLEETIRNLKEKSKERSKLIETRVGNSTGEIYKCPYCPKTFVSALFVNAHVARRHLYISDTHMFTSSVHEHYRAETEKLHNEIKILKERLNQTERVIINESDKLLDNTDRDYIRNMNKNEYNVITTDKQEQKKYQEDISSLKNMLFNEIRALREKEQNMNENILEANVKTLISQQEREIESLRRQLLERLTPGIENMQVKLQTQENYWKSKLEDIEAQHHRDIEKLTTELKVTQQATDHTKSEYVSKVHDLERLSMDQSNILVEQGKQLNSLSREINNSQIQSNNYKTGEKGAVEKFHESPVLKMKRDNVNSYTGDSESYRKNLSSTGNDEMVIEDISSESSQEYSDRYASNKKDAMKSRYIRRSVTDLGRIAEHAAAKSNSKNLQRLKTVRRTRDKAKHDISRKMDETQNRSNISFSIKNFEDFPINVTKKYNGERKRILHNTDDMSSKKSEFSEKRSVSSITETESSSMSQLESDNKSVTMNDDITVKQYEMKAVVQSSDARRSSIQKDTRSMFDNQLKNLGIDPEWQGIPAATFKQKMDIVKHQQNLNAKKFAQYNRIKQKILEDVLRRISAVSGQTVNMKFPLYKPVTYVKSKAVKALSSHIDSDKYESVQKTENTTPSKLRLKQKIDLLPRKYKDEETFEDTPEFPLIKNRSDVYISPKITSTQPRLIADHYKNANQNISSASSMKVESSPKNIKQISYTKITVLDSSARKVDSPIGRKRPISSKLPENNDSDSTILQEDSVVSPKNNKSVLKSTNGSVGNLIKKKVIFDLEDGKNETTLPENNPNRKIQVNNSDWNILSSSETRDCTLQKEKSMNIGSNILKTSQSDKIAEISKKIQKQLSIVRKPVGSVETVFRSNMNLQDLTDYNAGNQLLNSTSLPNTIAGNLIQSFTSPKAKNNTLFPQRISRTLKDKDFIVVQHESELFSLKYSDLDSDIDEILQME